MKKLNIAVLCGSLLAAPAVAQSEATRGSTQVVSTRGLDLGTARGQKDLDMRIATAAREMCGMPSAADLEGWKKVRLCREAAVRAVAPARDKALAKAAGRTPVQSALLARD